MTMRLDPLETPIAVWRPVSDDQLADVVLTGAAARRETDPAGARPAEAATTSRFVLVDARGGSGKSTFAARLAARSGATVVRTDDLSWQHHPIDWDDLLVHEVIQPWRAGRPVRFRPPAWDARGREGAVTVPAPCRLLVVEGVGAARRGLAELADVVIWVQSDLDVARTRGIARDVELGRTPAEAEAYWEMWAAHEDPFLAADRPWSRADVVVCGTPPPDLPPGTTLLGTGPCGCRAR